MNEVVLFELKMDHPADKKLEVIFKAFPEFENYRKNHFELQSDIDFVDRELNKGNEAAWFCASVTVRLKNSPLEASEYLGACSYESFEDFIDLNCYFGDMVKTATSDLKESINKLNKMLADYLN